MIHFLQVAVPSLRPSSWLPRAWETWTLSSSAHQLCIAVELMMVDPEIRMIDGADVIAAH